MSSQTPLDRLTPSLVHPIDTDEMGTLERDAGQTTVRTAIREVAGMQKEALVRRLDEGRGWRLSSDEGDYLDGADIAPSPLATMAAGIAAGYLDAILGTADKREVDIDAIDLTLDTFYTMQGSALKGDMRGGVLAPELNVEVESGHESGAVAELIEDAVERSVVTDLMSRELANQFTLTWDGSEIDPDRVPQAGSQPPSDPLAVFEEISRPSSPHEPEVIRHTGRETEDFPGGHEKYTAGQGSSLAEEQDRVLHVRARVSPRDDGLFGVEQKIYSPKGSIFETVIQPRQDDGARAPDAMAYIAAGIGFCFMTQFGRYAEIKRKDLSSYRIVQDLSWSGDLTTGEEERIEPIVTHVYLETSEGESFARELLDFSEQTCFLHALCRSSVEPDLSVAAQ